MENNSVYSRLRKMESVLSQIPKETKDLYKMRIVHYENDYVGLGIYCAPHELGYMGIDANYDIQVECFKIEHLNVEVVYLRFDNVSITLYPGSTPNAMVLIHKNTQP